MADEADSRGRTDEELVATDEDAASAAAREMAKALYVSGPGIIVSYDASKQTATVQPAIKRKFGGEVITPKPIVDVPIYFPAGGNMIITFPVAPDDECWLVFADRAIDNWWAKGGTQEPHEIRFHDPSDCVAFVGVTSNPRALSPAPATDGLEIRTREGIVIFRAVSASSGGGVEASVLSEKLLDCIRKMTFATGMGPTGVGPINVADFENTIKSKTAFVGE